MTAGHVAVDVAWGTPQFWLLWGVLCMNVTAGIGVLGQASPMIQEIFSGRVTAAGGRRLRRPAQPVQHGRPLRLGEHSDYIGRRNTYFVFFALGILLYSSVPDARAFRARFRCSSRRSSIILSMYGGGFATIPAYLRDIFGTMHVGAIHGRLLDRLVGGGRAWVRCW